MHRDPRACPEKSHGRVRRATGALGPLLPAAALLLRPSVTLAQCAMCNSAAGAGDVGRSLSLSVLFLLGALFLTVAGLVGVVLRARRHEARTVPDKPPEP